MARHRVTLRVRPADVSARDADGEHSGPQKTHDGPSAVTQAVAAVAVVVLMVIALFTKPAPSTGEEAAPTASPFVGTDPRTDGGPTLSSDAVTSATATSPSTVTYPYTVERNETFMCVGESCWADDRMSSILISATVYGIGKVDVDVMYTNRTSSDIEILFDPANELSATKELGTSIGEPELAYADEGDGRGRITVPAGASKHYRMSFSRLSPAPGTQCELKSDIEQGGVFTIYYEPVAIPCR